MFAALEPIVRHQLLANKLSLHFKGLIGAMDDNLTEVEKAKVIFCEPVQDDSYSALQEVAQVIKEAFEENGFDVKQDENMGRNFRIVLV